MLGDRAPLGEALVLTRLAYSSWTEVEEVVRLPRITLRRWATGTVKVPNRALLESVVARLNRAGRADLAAAWERAGAELFGEMWGAP